MRLLDLFCGGGGAGYGYRLAGFDVVGVDIKKRQCGYPAGEFVKADVREVLSDLPFLRSFDAIHASPPCQTHSRTKHLRDAQGKGTDKVDLIPETREALERSRVPYVIENVEGAPLRCDLLLCGSMFPRLHVYDDTGRRWLKRHRIFETNVLVPQRSCRHRHAGVRPLGVYGSLGDDIPSGGQTCRSVEQARELMGCPVDVVGGARRSHPAGLHGLHRRVSREPHQPQGGQRMNDDQWDWLILGGGLTILVAFLVVLAIFSRGAMP